MTPLEELIAARLTRGQKNYFIGYIAQYVDSQCGIDRPTWTKAIQRAKAQVWS